MLASLWLSVSTFPNTLALTYLHLFNIKISEQKAGYVLFGESLTFTDNGCSC